MDVLSIRRNRSLAISRYTSAVKTAKPEAAAATTTGRSEKSTGLTVSDTLQQLMTRINQAADRTQASRRTLQTGEGLLAEVQDNLSRLLDLAQKSASDGKADRAALQEQLEQLLGELDRMLDSSSVDGTKLFLEEGALSSEHLETFLRTVLDSASDQKGDAQGIPDWLTQAMRQHFPSAKQLLAALGQDAPATGAKLVAAVAGKSLDSHPAIGYVAALYLGAVIAGDPEADFDTALVGLQKLFDQIADGVSPDEALAQLTNGLFTSFEDFESQFLDGTAPDMQKFLVSLLLADSGTLSLPDTSLFALLGAGGMNLDLLMGALSMLPFPEAAEGLDRADAAGTQTNIDSQQNNTNTSGIPTETVAQTASRTDQTGPSDGIQNNPASEQAARTPAGAASKTVQTPLSAEESGESVSTARFGDIQVTGRDLSQVTFQASTGLLTIGGNADVHIQGAGPQAVLITGSGTVTFQDADLPLLTIDTPSAHIRSVGENILGNLRLQPGVSLTMSGSGQFDLDRVQGDKSNTVHVTSGAVIVRGEKENVGTMAMPVVLEEGVSLAARPLHVSNAARKSQEPFDMIWKTLLPGWNRITSLMVDGKTNHLSLLNGNSTDPARIWLDKGDPNHGNPIHTIFINGKDEENRPRTQYLYLRWNQNTETFQAVSMYPNPFQVTGGEQKRDWIYDEPSHTLQILSDQVTSVSGGAGTDATQAPFSGRIALNSHLGKLSMTLDGVNCQVSVGKAFDLGRENDITLFLQDGTENHFSSGAGCAGISIGDGTILRIDRSPSHEAGSSVGKLTAIAGNGGAGIGRDSGGSWDRISQIWIHGGVLTATGAGGGAGIGAGEHGFMGPVTITGGTIYATGGKGGGAGIGGALGAPVDTIDIRGGLVTAIALYQAAAIGAGIQGESGDIRISGTARIVKAQGGNPGADIGACLFGTCGDVEITGGADIGSASILRRKEQRGIPLQMGEEKIMLPQFPLSSKALQLHRMGISTREQAKATLYAIEVDRRWVARIQATYHTLCSRLEQNLSRLRNARQYLHKTSALVRDTGGADSLLQDMERSILQSSQAVHAHSEPGIGNISRLFS